MSPPVFAHEKLNVYGKALDFAAKAVAWTTSWDKRNALVDHLARASESVLSNLAEAARKRGASGRLRITDYAIGSALECAGCLDLAQIKGLLPPVQCYEEKCQLCEVTKMLIGLRKAWAESVVREEPLPCSGPPPDAPIEPLFHHERLEVYRTALGLMEWFASQPGTNEVSNRLLRQLDEAGTSVVLNIAEGNGRYADLDHRHFLEIAQSGAVKAAVYLDVCRERGVWVEAEVAAGKEKLRRINLLLGGF